MTSPDIIPPDRLRQLAIVLGVLDEATSALLWGQFSPTEREAIRAAAATLGDVPDEEQQRITSDFLRHLSRGRTVGASLSQVPGVCEPAAGSDLPESAGHVLVAKRAGQDLSATPRDVLFAVLGQEHPQTIAVVLAALAPRTAAAILEMLPTRRQNEIVFRLAEMREVDDGVLEELFDVLSVFVQRELEKRRLRDARDNRLKSILGATSASSRSQWISRLSRFDLRLAAVLDDQASASPSATAGSAEADHDGNSWLSLILSDLGPSALSEVLQRAGDEVTQLALAGTSNAVVNELLARLPDTQAAQLRSGFATIGPIRLADVRQAQRFIARLAETRWNRGEDEVPEKSGRLKLSA